MNIWDKIEACKDTLTPKELEIYELVQKDPYSFSTNSSMEIASKYKVSQSAISRFCQKAGFSGFADFRLSMTGGYIANLPPSNKSSIQLQEDTDDCAHLMCDNVMRTRQALPDELLDSLVMRILNATNIYASGYGSSMCTAQTFSFCLTVLGSPCHMLFASQEMETLHILKNTDVVFLFSIANPSHRDFLSLVTDLPPEKRPYIILVSGIAKHPLRHKVSEVVTLHMPSAWNHTLLPITTIQFTFALLVADRLTQLRQNIKEN